MAGLWEQFTMVGAARMITILCHRHTCTITSVCVNDEALFLLLSWQDDNCLVIAICLLPMSPTAAYAGLMRFLPSGLASLQALKHYETTTADKRSKFERLRERDQQSSITIAAQLRRLQRLQEAIAACKQQHVSNRVSSEQRNMYVAPVIVAAMQQ